MRDVVIHLATNDVIEKDNAKVVCLALKQQREQLKKPPRTVDEHLTVVREQGLPRFVDELEPSQLEL